jgi:hypothetical protein
MKRFMFAVMAVLILAFVGCEKEDPKPQSNDSNINAFMKALSDTEGLEITGYERNFLMQTPMGYDTLTVCVGMKNEVFWMGLFEGDQENYKTVYTWTDTRNEIPIEKSFSVDMGYGNTQNYNFTGIVGVPAPIEHQGYFGQIVRNEFAGIGFNNGNKLLSVALNYRDAYMADYNYYSLNLAIFIDDSGQGKVLQSSATAAWYFRIWFDNTFILGSFSQFSCYDFNDNLIWRNDNSIGELFRVTPVSVEEGIILEMGWGGMSWNVFFRININNGMDVWSSKIQDTEFGLPENARFDSYEQTKQEYNNWYYAFHYTLYSGEKVTREICIDIETGEISYL